MSPSPQRGDQSTQDLARDARLLRSRFLERIEPFRPDLHSFCRMLTGDRWDAEDLAQETLLRAFARLSDPDTNIENHRAWLFRIAANHWIDQTRRRRPEPLADPDNSSARLTAHERAPEVREALARLAQRLPPQERIALLARDVFGLSLKETASLLDTSVGAAKSALHRARSRLTRLAADQPPGPHKPATPAAPSPPQRLIDACTTAFNRRDVNRLAHLLADSDDPASTDHDCAHTRADDDAFDYPPLDHARALSAECINLGDEQVIVLRGTKTRDDEPQRPVHELLRFTLTDEGIRIRRHRYFCPETIEQISHRLGLPLHRRGSAD